MHPCYSKHDHHQLSAASKGCRLTGAVARQEIAHEVDRKFTRNRRKRAMSSCSCGEWMVVVQRICTPCAAHSPFTHPSTQQCSCDANFRRHLGPSDPRSFWPSLPTRLLARSITKSRLASFKRSQSRRRAPQECGG